MEIMNTTENAPSAKKLQMIINSGISKNSIKVFEILQICKKSYVQDLG